MDVQESSSSSSFSTQLCNENFCSCRASRKSKNSNFKSTSCQAEVIVRLVPAYPDKQNLLKGVKAWEGLVEKTNVQHHGHKKVRSLAILFYKKLKSSKSCFEIIQTLINLKPTPIQAPPSALCSAPEPLPPSPSPPSPPSPGIFQELAVKIKRFSKMFTDVVRQYATVPCFICNRTLYPNGRTTALITEPTKTLMMELNPNLAEQYFLRRVTLCWRCSDWNSRGKLHGQCKHNDLIPEDAPPEIECLPEVALQIISQVRPFLKILRLSCRDGQLALKGSSVYFPQSVEDVVEQLPLQSSESDIIIVNESLQNLKNQRQYAICPKAVENALLWLKKNNHLYSHVQISKENLSNLNINDMTVTVDKPENPADCTADPFPHGKNVGFTKIKENDDQAGQILRGTIHQGNENFPSNTRGRQCTCMSVAAVAYSAIQSSGTWTRAVVDEILITGNRHFQIENNKREENVKESYMLISDAVGEVQNVFGRITVTVAAEDRTVITGAMSKIKSKDVTRMPEAIESFLQSGGTAASITAGEFTMALIIDNEDVFLFDSHSRGDKGHQSAAKSGTACVLKFTKQMAPQKLSRIIQHNCQPKSDPHPNMSLQEETRYMFSITRLSAHLSDEKQESCDCSEDEGSETETENMTSSSSSSKRSFDCEGENEPKSKKFKPTPTRKKKYSEDSQSDRSEPPAKKIKIQSALNALTNNSAFDTLLHSVDYTEPKKEEFLKNGQMSTFCLHRKTGKPINLKLEQRYEELSFVKLFPSGRFGINHPRRIKITPLEYCQQRLMSADSRFANPAYLFHSLCIVENWKINQKISVCCDMQRQQEGPGNSKDDDTDHPGNIHLVLKSIRGTSSYWSSYAREVIAMIKMLERATFFLTFSYNDMNSWDSINAMLKAKFGFDVPDRDPDKMSYAEKQDLLNSNPVAAARHFNYRVKQFFLILQRYSKEIFGYELEHFTYRIEFQLRGSPHVHCILWLKGVPEIGTPEYIEFLDRNIFCSLSTAQRDLVLRYQVHHHSATCFKKENCKMCRFGYPRKAAEKTRILTEDEIEKNRGKFVEHQRTAEEIFVNNYHPILLEMLQSNMDLQAVTNVKAIAYYIAKYMSKSEPDEIRKEIQTALESAKQTQASNQKTKLQQQTRQIMKKREVSEQEAAFRLCHLTLHESSRSTVFVPAFKKEERVRCIDRETINGTNPKFYTNIIEKYQLRPKTPEFEPLSLFEFAALYQPVQSAKLKDLNFDLQEEGEETVHAKSNSVPRKKFKLLNSKGYIEKRTKFAIVDYPNFNPITNSDDYYNSMLVLYLPFREETFLNGFESPAQAFQHWHPHLRKSSDSPLIKHEFVEELNRCILQLAEYVSKPKNKDSLDIDDDFSDEIFDEIETTPKKMSRPSAASIMERIRRLGPEQRQVFNYVKNSLDSSKQNQIKLVVSGSAGSGKSYLIKLIKDYINALYFDSSEDKVVLCAPTGVAATAISGTTIHRAFGLQVEKGSAPKYSKLKSKKLEELRNKFRGKKLIVLDEYSMVSYEILRIIDLRLREILDNEEPFGGIHIMFFGDLMQLKPIHGSWIFTRPPRFEHEPHLWHEFTHVQLLANQRQKSGDPLLPILTRLRVGETTVEDIEQLQTRILDPSRPDFEEKIKFFEDALHLFPTTKLAEAYNKMRTEKLSKTTTVYQIDAIDSYSSIHDQFKPVNPAHVPKKTRDTAGIPATLRVGVGSRVMLLRNMDVESGLCNGSQGTVVGFEWRALRQNQREQGEIPDAVLVRFDAARPSHYMSSDGICRIPAQSIDFSGKRGNIISRYMIPLVECFATTIHKVQALTLDKVVVHLGSELFAKGQAYVALSRVRSFNGLGILKLNVSKLLSRKEKDSKGALKIISPCDLSALAEIERMIENSLKDSKTAIGQLENEVKSALANLPIDNEIAADGDTETKSESAPKSGHQGPVADGSQQSLESVDDTESSFTEEQSYLGDHDYCENSNSEGNSGFEPGPYPDNSHDEHFFRIPEDGILQPFAMKWYRNSCYFDAVLISMFYARNHFDEIIYHRDSDSDSVKLIKSQLQVLVCKLRSQYSVDSDSSWPLRLSLSTFNQEFLGSFVDASLFIETLLGQGLMCRGFINSGTERARHTYMISPSSRMKLGNFATIDQVLFDDIVSHSSFFQERPNPGLILVQLRGRGARPITIPCPSLEIGGEGPMILSAIVCFIPSRVHYTCYARDQLGWLYFDEKVRRVPTLATELALVASNPNREQYRLSSPELQDVCANGYILFYN